MHARLCNPNFICNFVIELCILRCDGRNDTTYRGGNFHGRQDCAYPDCAVFRLHGVQGKKHVRIFREPGQRDGRPDARTYATGG